MDYTWILTILSHPEKVYDYEEKEFIHGYETLTQAVREAKAHGFGEFDKNVDDKNGTWYVFGKISYRIKWEAYAAYATIQKVEIG